MFREGGPLEVGAVDQTTGALKPLFRNSSGELLVTSTGGGGGGTSSNFGATFPATGTAAGFIDDAGDMAGANLDASGNLLVNVAAGGTSGTQYNQGTATTDTDTMTMAGAVRRDTAAVASGVADGDRLVLSTDASGRLRTTAADTTQPISAASLPLPTGAATEATLAGVLTSTNFAAAFGTAGTADSQVMSVQGIASMTPVQVSQATASNLNATVVGTGTFAAQVTAVGTIADGSATPGNPVMVGGFMKWPDGTDPGSVTPEDDVTRFITDANRRQYVNTVHPRFGHKHLDGSTAYTDESLVSDPGDGFQTIITSIIVGTNAGTAMNFFLEEGSTKIFGPYGLEAVAGRGFVSGPIFLPVTASTAVTITTSASIAQAVDVDYFIQAVP